MAYNQIRPSPTSSDLMKRIPLHQGERGLTWTAVPRSVTASSRWVPWRRSCSKPRLVDDWLGNYTKQYIAEYHRPLGSLGTGIRKPWFYRIKTKSRKASVRLGSFRFVETSNTGGSVHPCAGSFRFVWHGGSVRFGSCCVVLQDERSLTEWVWMNIK